MHLGLTDGPSVPYNLISTQQSPVPLPKFQLVPRLKILLPSGSKKGTQIYFFFSLKSPGKRTPSRFPNRAPMERYIPVYGVFFTYLSKSSFFFSSLKGLSKERPSVSPAKQHPPIPLLPFWAFRVCSRVNLIHFKLPGHCGSVGIVSTLRAV
jgi:hypothetical protein